MTKKEQAELEERVARNRWEHRPYRIVAVDFDGCLVENEWPNIGKPLAYNIATVQQYMHHGDKIILWTCRTGELLEAALTFCEEHGIRFAAVNDNIPEVIERFGGDARKIYADVYLDDKAERMSELTNARQYRQLHYRDYNWEGKPSEKWLAELEKEQTHDTNRENQRGNAESAG